MSERVGNIVGRVKEYLQRQYGACVKAVLLYGSHARGTPTEDSDVDLLVVVDEALDPCEVRRTLSDFLFEILLETGELVSVVVVPEAHYQTANTPFLINVRREGVPI
jgi:predicted nucleotidyltransferase